MLVVALLQDSFLLRLIEAVKAIRGTVIRATDWSHMHQLLQDRPVTMAIVDPSPDSGLGLNAVKEIAGLLHRFPSTPILAYTHLTSEGVRSLSYLGRHGLREVILYQYDDSPLRLGRLLVRASSHGIVSRVRRGLQGNLSALPVDIAQAVDDLFQRPHAYTSGYDLVLASRAPKASLHRSVQQAGLAPPRQLFVGARIAHAATYLRDPGTRIQDVAVKLGYRHSYVMTRHTMLALGVRPSSLRHVEGQERLSDDEIVARLLTWVQQVGADDGPDDDDMDVGEEEVYEV
ncbi:MAG TPA: hypothetical protein VNU46_08235 [Gemmatimonadaceae bacterium]|nr:hypothetical protein [Gemmatimonadaceae bacterium]